MNNDVISAAFILTDRSYNVISKLSKKVRPVSISHWSEAAEGIHNITREMCESFQQPFGVCAEILQWLAPYRHPKNIPMRFIYHANSPFDWHFLRALFYKQDLEYSLYKVINWKNLESTMKMARSAGHKKVSLNHLATNFGISLDHHNAESDVNACFLIHERLSDILFVGGAK